MKIKLISIFFLLSFSFLPLSFHKVLAVHVPPTVDVYRLTSGFYREDWPMIHNDTVYWSDSVEIKGYDFKKQQEVILAKVGEELPLDFFAPTAYDGRYLVYNTYSVAKGYNIQVYDFNRKQDIIVTDEVGSNTATDYDNNTIVYIEGGACGKLHAFDVNLKEDTLVTETACGPAKISGNIIVWNYATPGGTNVYGYDLKKHGQFDIAIEDGFQSSPDIYGNDVVWIHSEGADSSIRLKNLKTGNEKVLNQSSTYSMSWPSISKRYVVWGKNTAQHISGVEGVDLKTGEVFETQEQGQHQNDNLSAIVNDNIVAWMAWRTGNGDIYAAIINH